MTDRKAKQTPLPDLLDRVPDDIVLGIPGDEPVFPSYTNIPIGRLARQAAAELRRLSAENAELWKEREEPHRQIQMYMLECNRLERERDALKAQRDALLEALQALYDEQEGPPLIRRHRQWQAAMDKARAAIKAVGENT